MKTAARKRGKGRGCDRRQVVRRMCGGRRILGAVGGVPPVVTHGLQITSRSLLYVWKMQKRNKKQDRE